MDAKDEKNLLRNNPLFVISIASLVAVGMFTISIVSYYRSDTRKTIDQIQLNNETSSSKAKEQGDPQKLDSEYIDNVEKSINEDISSHSADTDFSSDELTDSALGL